MKLDYKIISFLLRGKRRMAVLSALQKEKMPKQISEELKLSLSNVSLALKELRQKKLIECLNPKEKLFKFYSLTKRGKIAINQLDEYNKRFS